MPVERVFAIMQEDAPRALDAQCLEALRAAKLDTATSTPTLADLSAAVQTAIPIEK